MSLSGQRHVLCASRLGLGLVGYLDVVWVQLRELVKHLIVDKFAHVLDSDVGETNKALWSDHNLIIDDTIAKVPLLLDVKLNVILGGLGDNHFLVSSKVTCPGRIRAF